MAKVLANFDHYFADSSNAVRLLPKGTVVDLADANLSHDFSNLFVEVPANTKRFTTSSAAATPVSSLKKV